ncbi:hypothetical protein [Intrasporangium sp.]|uniref:hypothetical protein n=1 Tax=Intrasporangium sp. TaxID=1925024 RepID=UPI0032213EC2
MRTGRTEGGLLLVAVLLVALLALGGCAGRAHVRLDGDRKTGDATSAGTSPTSPAATTGTALATGPTTAPETVSPATGTTGAPTGTPLPPSPTLPAGFDASAARSAIEAVLADIRRLDQSLGATGGGRATASPKSTDRAAAARALSALDAHLQSLLAAGAPPGTDGPSYVARILGLQVFVSAAHRETSTDPGRAAARYRVIRSEVGVLLTQVGTSTGGTFTLPPSAPAR